MSNHKNCCDYYKKCYTKERAICDIEKKINSLVDNGFLPGISVGIICDKEIIYQNGFGVRNSLGDPYTFETNVQMENASLHFLSLYLANLSSTGSVCVEDRLVEKFNFKLNNNRATEISASISDIISGSLGYTFNNTKLSWLLCHDPAQVKELLKCRVFTTDFDSNLFRNKVLKFFGSNNFLSQSFFDKLNEFLGGGTNLHEKVKTYLNSIGFTDFNYGTSNFEAEANRAEGSIRRCKCYEDVPQAENVDDFETSVGAYSNIKGLLPLIKFILDKGEKGGSQEITPIALRQWFQRNKTRFDGWDNYSDTKHFPIPELKVTNASSFNMALGGGNYNFHVGQTTTGLRSLMSFDMESGFGVAITSRGKTVFPEALMTFIYTSIVEKDPCLADEVFNFTYRLFTPILEAQLPNIQIKRPCGPHHKYRKYASDIPLDGVVLSSCQGLITFNEVDDCLFATFGNCLDEIPLYRVGLDNYVFNWKDRSKLEYGGQIQIGYNSDNTIIEAKTSMFREMDIQFKQLSVIPPTSPCSTEEEPLPPLEEKCCHKDCYSINDYCCKCICYNIPEECELKVYPECKPCYPVHDYEQKQCNSYTNFDYY